MYRITLYENLSHTMCIVILSSLSTTYRRMDWTLVWCFLLTSLSALTYFSRTKWTEPYGSDSKSYGWFSQCSGMLIVPWTNTVNGIREMLIRRNSRHREAVGHSIGTLLYISYYIFCFGRSSLSVALSLSLQYAEKKNINWVKFSPLKNLLSVLNVDVGIVFWGARIN